MDSSLVAFTGVAALMTISPGPDMALMLRNVLRAGEAVVLPTTLGIVSGLAVWAVASGVGIATLVATSAEAYAALRLVGGAYLAVLGLVALRHAARGHVGNRAAPAAGSSPRVGAASAPLTGGGAFRLGLLTNVTNPKVGVFYATLLPQFIPPGAPVLGTSLLLAGIHALLGLAWLLLYGAALGRLGARLTGGAARRLLEAVTGMVLVALGARVAIEA
jgi:threonine/homoserine/homoserine lactone efflux protein